MSINATLIGQMITFTLLVWFTMKYIWPPLIGAIEERKAKIAEGLAAAEKGQHDMELAAKKAATVLREAKQQSADIINLAQKRANEIVEESKGTAKVEGVRMIDAAKAQIEQEMQQAQEAMRKEVSALALKAAGQILKQEIDKAKHKDLISKVSEQLGQA
ncbi:F0F1 ATP synthase subunit B [methanotrophic endosymbiont of Bathymodiolus puteoserpentis (Logatchev)]|uniref:F0F1 ATP synthase subunit B n=1 Tax=methanotrophic endosymbiont of Bathymodiolus puteoserpentis (Logatchev) TaxID=343235 RepID=UPI0013CBF5EA|nr:F0F1 ATP synthase subunit B [methanotrophic endosymbiont of Bathymodiolus puteoserpentis (Logatchev)]SHE23355.1 ATP synthase F0 sector subunit b [methanotrophic endosymbiont of Bathymodiolus puteoserpentis (Logatchev)]